MAACGEGLVARRAEGCGCDGRRAWGGRCGSAERAQVGTRQGHAGAGGLHRRLLRDAAIDDRGRAGDPTERDGGRDGLLNHDRRLRDVLEVEAFATERALGGLLHDRGPVQRVGVARRRGQPGCAGLLCRRGAREGVLCRVRGLEDRLGARPGDTSRPLAGELLDHHEVGGGGGGAGRSADRARAPGARLDGRSVGVEILLDERELARPLREGAAVRRAHLEDLLVDGRDAGSRRDARHEMGAAPGQDGIVL